MSITTRTAVVWFEQLKKGKHRNHPVRALAVSPVDSHVLISDWKTVRRHDLTTGSLLRACKGHREPIMTLSWALDGRSFASGDEGGVVIIWNTSGEQLHTYTHVAFMRTVAFHPGRELLASVSEEDVIFWYGLDAERGIDRFRVLQRRVPMTCFCAPVIGLRCAAWSPDGRMLAIGCATGMLYVCDHEADEYLRLAHKKLVSARCICWCECDDESIIAVGRADRTVSLTLESGLPYGAHVIALQSEPRSLLSWNNGLLIGLNDGKVCWYRLSGELIATITECDAAVLSLQAGLSRYDVLVGSQDGRLSYLRIQIEGDAPQPHAADDRHEIIEADDKPFMF